MSCLPFLFIPEVCSAERVLVSTRQNWCCRYREIWPALASTRSAEHASVDLSYIYLLALSSSVLSIHCVEAVISGSWTRQIRCLDRAQHLSLLMGLRLYGIALEPIIKVLKVLIIKVLKVLKNNKLIYYLILTCSFKDDFLVLKSNESETYFQWTNLIQFIFWIISKLVHVGIHHSNEFSVIVIHGKFFVKHRMAAVTDLFDLSQMAPLVL